MNYVIIYDYDSETFSSTFKEEVSSYEDAKRIKKELEGCDRYSNIEIIELEH